MKLSIITDQIDQDLEKALQVIQKKGYQYVELHNVFKKSIEECTHEEVMKVKQLLKKYNMKVTNIASTIFFLCPLYKDDCLSLFNPTFYAIEGNVEKHLRYLENACMIAKELDCPRIRIFPFRWPDHKEGPFGTNDEKERIMDSLKKAVSIAEKYDVILVLENCPYSRLPKGKMTFEVVQTIDNPHLKLLWDPANSFRAIQNKVPNEYLDLSLIEELELIFPYIDHVHVKDYHYDPQFEKPFVHTPIYDGDIDFDLLLNFLRSHNYQEAISLEPEVNYEDSLICMDRLKAKRNVEDVESF